jgi:hypothetical protein
MRSQGCVIEADKKLIGQTRQDGMGSSQVFEFIKHFYGAADKVPFSKIDCNNEIDHEQKKYMEFNDAQTLCNYLKNKQVDDPSFFNVVQIDLENSRIDNSF